MRSHDCNNLALSRLALVRGGVYQYGSVKGERRRGKGEEKTFNPYPLTFSPNQFLVQNAYPNRIEGCTLFTAKCCIPILS
jgi:hypothetical protein